MAKIDLSRSGQEHLGKRHRDRLKLVHAEVAEQRKHMRPELEFEDDYEPDLSGRLRFSQLYKGLCVVELPGTPSSRGGVIVGFRKVHGYTPRLPIVRWYGGLVSVSHPDLLERQTEQLSLF